MSMSDINLLSGFEFENLCRVLLERFGFQAEKTKQSGDGGIDILAHYNQPLFNGKYIIQCKRYTGGVGEPVVRDLYGVVMAERANKGILITTGHFTVSAVKFAADKNLELIDGEQLGELLYQADLLKEISSIPKKTFESFSSFDRKKYDFYMSMINQNLCTVEMGKDFLFSFLFEYFSRKEKLSNPETLDVIHNGLAKEYTRLFDWYTNKYYKRGKEQQELLPHYIRKFKGVAQLYNFDLFEYVKNRYEILKDKNILQLLAISEKEEVLSHTEILKSSPAHHIHIELNNFNDMNQVKAKVDYRFYEMMNMLSIFRYFRIEKGVEHIQHILASKMEKTKNWSTTICLKYGKPANIYVPVISPVHLLTPNGKEKFEYVHIKYNEELSLEKYFARYEQQHKEQLEHEIKKIELLLDSMNT